MSRPLMRIAIGADHAGYGLKETLLFAAQRARAHNDANVLCLGASVVGPGLASQVVSAFLSTAFEGGRHARRVEKIAAAEPHGRTMPSRH